jgi:AcrR family transcriptional regulator
MDDRSYSKKLSPPSKAKIVKAMKLLLAKRDFESITSLEIARTAKVNDSLLFRHFKDKRGLLHYILSSDIHELVTVLEKDLDGMCDPIKKIKTIIHRVTDSWDKNRTSAKIAILEVRNNPDYFKSETYMHTKNYTDLILKVIEEGVNKNKLRNDVSPAHMRQILLGSIEHVCLPYVIFKKKMKIALITKNISKMFLEGALNREATK